MKMSTFYMNNEEKIKFLRKCTTFLYDIGGADKVYKILCCTLKLTSNKRANDVASSLALARYPLRFWGTLDATIEVLTCKSLLKDPSDIQSQLRLIQAVALLFFHPAEHLLWVERVSPGSISEASNKKLTNITKYTSVITCTVTIIRSIIKYRSMQAELKLLCANGIVSPSASEPTAEVLSDSGVPSKIEKDYCADIALLRAEIRNHLIKMSKEFLDLICCYHFALSSGLGLSDRVVNLIGIYSALIGGRTKWNALNA